MLADGWLDEVARLRERPGGLSNTARQAIGYAELTDHLDGRVDLDEAVRRTKSRTRRYAHRQQRWFASDPRVQWAAAPQAAQLLEDRAR
jgi:tRNA dimethylallyltransferase